MRVNVVLSRNLEAYLKSLPSPQKIAKMFQEGTAALKVTSKPEVRQALAECVRMLPQITQARRAASQAMKHAKEGASVEQEKVAKALNAAEWPPLWRVPLSCLEPLVELVERCEDLAPYRSQIDTAVLDAHPAEAIRKMLQDWGRHPIVKRRYHILSEAIHAYLNRQYAVSIPPILAQVEGLIAEVYGHEGKLRGNDLEQYLRGLDPHQQRFAYSDLFRYFYDAVVLVQFRHGAPIVSLLSRHAILHGADLNYPTAANSLKAILLVDHVALTLRYIGDRTSCVFHRIECPRVGDLGPDRVVYSRWLAFAMEGWQPCAECRPGFADDPEERAASEPTVRDAVKGTPAALLALPASTVAEEDWDDLEAAIEELDRWDRERERQRVDG